MDSMITEERKPFIPKSVNFAEEDDVRQHVRTHTPRLYGMRWVMLCIYFFVAVASNGIALTFGPIDKLAGKCFQEKQIAVNSMSLGSQVSGIFLLLPALAIVKRTGVRKAMLGLALFQIFCGLLRIVTPLVVAPLNEHLYFWLIFASQLCVALPVAFLTSLPAQISGNWFGERERNIATSVGSLSQLVGLAAGQTSGYAVNATCDFRYLFIGQGIFCCLTGAAGFFFKSHPPTPPSLSRSQSVLVLMSLTQEIRAAFRVLPYVLLLLVYWMGMGVFVALWALLQSVVGSTHTATSVSLILCGSGIVGAVVVGIVLDRFRFARTYKVLLVVSVVGGAVGLALFSYGVWVSHQVLLMVGAAIAGCFLVGQIPVAFELGQELVYPVSATTSTALLLIGGNVVGLVWVLIFSLVKQNHSLILSCCFGSYVVTAAICIPFLKPECKRLNLEQEKHEVLAASNE